MLTLPNWFRFPFVLMIVTGISGVGLTALWHATLPQKNELAAQAATKAISEVMPRATRFEKKHVRLGEQAVDYQIAYQDDHILGYIAIGEGVGYSSTIKVMVSVLPDMHIFRTKVLYQKETPGLGDKILEIKSNATWGKLLTGNMPDESKRRPWFQTQFDGKKAPLQVTADGGQVDAITGATITSRAMCVAINDAINQLSLVLSQ